MRGVKLNFFGDSPVFDFSDTVKDFAATMQNAMVNFGTVLGSDPVYPDRGTYLLQDALQGRMLNLQWANSSANFAAVRTLVFCQSTEIPGNAYGLQDLNLEAPTFNIYNLQFNVTATCTDGSTAGVAAQL